MLCRVGYRDIVLIPCMHDVTCSKCSTKLINCPLCKTALRDVKTKVKTAEEADRILK